MIPKSINVWICESHNGHSIMEIDIIVISNELMLGRLRTYFAS